jgi:flagellar assembly protein FliH
MSSSRIIKSTSAKEHGTHFILEEFQAEEQSLFQPDVEAFQPLFTKPTVRVMTDPAPVFDSEALLAGMISEDDAQQRIDEAYDSGFAEGRRQVEEDCTAVSRSFGTAMSEISDLREVLLKESEDDLLRLAIMLAERIIRQEITLNRKILARIVADVVENMADKDGLVIRFNPEDYRIISDNRYLDQAGIAGMKHVDVKPDENVAHGGCLIETSSGQVDGQIEAQLTELFNQLMEERVHNSFDSVNDQDNLSISFE